jgi:hypothetical protein
MGPAPTHVYSEVESIVPNAILPSHPKEVEAVAAVRLDDGSVLVATSGADGNLHVWARVCERCCATLGPA